jgi:serine phosphatase RsbU (regulator of sigma subunit)
VAVACLVAAAIWGRSAQHLARVERRVRAGHGDDDSASLARTAWEKEVHATALYLLLAVAAAGVALTDDSRADWLFALVLVPVAASIVNYQRFAPHARRFEDRAMLERRAEEVLSQEELAPRRWAERLAPDALPEFPGFEIGRVYQPGTGLMAGDFYDVVRIAPTRIAAVIGDVTGHGIEPSITAFQAKYLLRVFLRQYRDPAQAIEELNNQMAVHARVEEFVSLVVVVFDTEAGTMRYASAGHPAALLWHDREVRPLGATGPLLLLEPGMSFFSREIPLEEDDVMLLYTDGLAEARAGENMFGEERIANHLRKDPTVTAEVLCKSLLSASRDFATSALSDDVAILAIRRG